MRIWVIAGMLLAGSSGAALAQDAAAGEQREEPLVQPPVAARPDDRRTCRKRHLARHLGRRSVPVAVDRVEDDIVRVAATVQVDVVRGMRLHDLLVRASGAIVLPLLQFDVGRDQLRFRILCQTRRSLQHRSCGIEARSWV